MNDRDWSKSRCIDIKALSEYLQIKVSTLYAWTSQKKIPCIKIHGVIRFRKEEIDEWLDSFHRKKSEAAPMKFKGRKSDIDSLIARAKREVYNGSCGETRPESAQRKEKQNGAV